MTTAREPGAPDDTHHRRRLTLLYADLCGSTALSAEMEAEDYRALLRSLRDVWHAAAAQHGGVVVLTQGDGALLAFGIPLAGEHDGRRAAEAALQIRHNVTALRPSGVPAGRLPLQLHAGIHAGNLLLTEGDIERGVFDLSGEVLNITAQLARQARPGEVLASVAALGPNALFFRLGEVLQPLNLPQAALAQQVHAVLGHGDASRRFDATALRGLTPFIGRTAPVEALRAFRRGAARGLQRCLVLQGNPGMGKTRLLEELLAADDAPDATVLRGNCESDLGAGVLQPFVQMLQSWSQQAPAARAPTAAAEAAAQAAALLGLSQPSSSPRGQHQGPAQAPAPVAAVGGVVGQLLAFFTALASARPCLLVIDDWQWADDASRQLLQALLQSDAGPALLLAARMREDGGDWVAGAAHVRLEPFRPQETATVVQRLLSRPDPFLVARIHDYAGGVPLYIEELCHSVSAEQVLLAIEGRSAAQGWLATLVVSRLERLPAAQAAVVRAAAVVGNLVPMRWLAVACGETPSHATLQALADADFLRREPLGDALRFKHGITRDAVYESIGRHERIALHRRLEAALQDVALADHAGESLEALAYHCRCAGSWDAAATHAERAGDKAMALFALDRARAQFLSAIESLDQLGPPQGDMARRWCLLANKLGLTCIFDLLALPDALVLFRRAVDLAGQWGDAGVQARAHYWMAYMLYGHGWPQQSRQHCRQAILLAEQAGDLRLAAQVRATLGQVLTSLCAYDEALALMDTALGEKRGQVRRGSSVAVGSAFTLACKASVLGDRGDFRASQAAFAEAMELLGDTAHPVANSMRSWEVMVLLWQGRWNDALAVAEHSMVLSRRSSALLPMAIANAAAGYALWKGRGQQAGVAQIEAAVHWLEQRNVQFYTSIYHGWLVEALLALQRRPQARHHARRLLARARAGEVLGLGTGRRALALADCAAGDHARAQRQLARADLAALQRQSPREQALNLRCRAELLAAQGALAPAHDAALAASAAFQAMDMRWHAAESDAWIATLG